MFATCSSIEVDPVCGDYALLSTDDADALVLIAAIWLVCSKIIGAAYHSRLHPSLQSNCVLQ